MRRSETAPGHAHGENRRGPGAPPAPRALPRGHPLAVLRRLRLRRARRPVLHHSRLCEAQARALHADRAATPVRRSRERPRMTFAHPTDETLFDYALGQLAADESDAVEAHVRDCAACRQIVVDFRAIEAVSRDAATWEVIDGGPVPAP